MIIRKTIITEINDDTLMEKIPSVYALAKELNMSHSYVHKVMNNQVPVSEEQYERFKKLIEEKYSTIDNQG